MPVELSRTLPEPQKADCSYSLIEVKGLGFRVQGLGFRVAGLLCNVSGDLKLGDWAWGFSGSWVWLQ